MNELKPVAWMWEHHGVHVTTDTALVSELQNEPHPVKVTPLYAIPDAAPLTDQIRTLAAHMIKVAASMEYYGGFNSEIRDKSLELLGASHIAENWADAIEDGDVSEKSVEHDTRVVDAGCGVVPDGYGGGYECNCGLCE